MSNFANRCIKRLLDLGYSPEQKMEERKIISVSENGKTYTVNVKNDAKSIVYQIDNYIITNGERCDKFIGVIKENKGIAILVELKGKDVAHAIAQLETTINNVIFKPFPDPDDKARARIVTSTCGPSSASKIIYEKAKIRFKQKYNLNLAILHSKQKDNDINF